MKVSIPTDGKAIRRLRQLGGHNSTPFAKEVGITVGYLSRLERGDRQASPAVLGRIARKLHVTVADLMPAKDLV